jgi:hypothetical protein
MLVLRRLQVLSGIFNHFASSFLPVCSYITNSVNSSKEPSDKNIQEMLEHAKVQDEKLWEQRGDLNIHPEVLFQRAPAKLGMLITVLNLIGSPSVYQTRLIERNAGLSPAVRRWIEFNDGEGSYLKSREKAVQRYRQHLADLFGRLQREQPELFEAAETERDGLQVRCLLH